MNVIDSQFLLSQFDLDRSLDPAFRLALLRALESEGSFSRAQLAAGVAASLGLAGGRSKLLASGIELFHLASLILDDLPCMDNAETRRGQACVHVAAGESNAILAALALINKAYVNLWKAFEGSGPDAREEAARLVEECLGVEGILNGQAMDLNFENYRMSESNVARVAQEKTGSLFRLCLMLPAILGGASRYEKMHLCRLAQAWGLAYQVADDLKDVLLGESSSGKTSQRDTLLGRPNMALAIGVESATKLLKGCLEESVGSLKALESGDRCAWQCLRAFHESFAEKAVLMLRSEAAA